MIIDAFENLITLEEAAEKWDINPMDIMEKIANEEFIKDIDIKRFNKQWILSNNAMTRVFGSLNQEDSGLIMANMPYASSRYESYVRNAFMVKRGEDPAKLAMDEVLDMSEEDLSYFAKAKAASGYSAYIYNADILEDKAKFLEENEATILDILAQNILNAKDKIELFDALDRHYALVEDIYNRK